MNINFSHLAVLYSFMVQVIKNPITVHLPTGCRKLGTSFSSDKLVDMEDYASDEPVVVVIGAMAHGKVCGGMCIGVLLEVIRGVHISQFIIAATILPFVDNAGGGGLHRRGSGHQRIPFVCSTNMHQSLLRF